MKQPSWSEQGWHILRPVSGEYVPTRVHVFLIEPLVRWITDRCQEHTFRLGVGRSIQLGASGAVDASDTVFTSPEDALSWLHSRYSSRAATWIYSYHLPQQLSLIGWWRAAWRAGERIQTAVLSDPPNLVISRRGRCTSKYVDLRNYWRDGLLAMARSSGISFPAGGSAGLSDSEAVEYCTKKVHFLGDCLCRAMTIVRSNQLCSWQPTAASLSFACLRHSCLTTPIWIHRHPQALSLETAALRGGTVRMWRSGYVPEPVTVVDANSLYPYVMRDYPLPVKFRNYEENPTLRTLAQALAGFECVAAIRLAPETADHVRAGKLAWCPHVSAAPVHLAGAELRKAWSLGLIERVLSMARYDAGAPLAEFVLRLQPILDDCQAKGDLIGRAFVKLLRNSLHGKFGQKGRKWVHDEKATSHGLWSTWIGTDPETGSPRRYRHLGGSVERYEEAGLWRHSFPGLSSSIAAAARIELAEHRDIAGAAQTLYCDTDSLHVVRNGHDRLVSAGRIHPTCCGKWKLLHRGEDATYWGLKHYRVGSKYCCCFLTPSATGIAEGVYLDAARRGFERQLQDGLPAAQYYDYRTVRVRDTDSGEHAELVDYGTD